MQITPKHAHALDSVKSEFADWAAVQALCGNPSGNKLTHNLSGNIWPQSSRLAEPSWTDPGIKSRINVHELIFTKKGKNPQSSQVRK